MTKQVLFNKRTDYPVITLLLVFTCVFVSILSLMFPAIDKILNAPNMVVYPWQRFTGVFAHGRAYDFIGHFFGNVTGLLLFGCLSERLIGVKRYSIVVIVCLTIYLLVFTLTNGYGNGISGIVWGLLPFGGVIVFHEIKQSLRRLFYVFNILYTLLLVWGIVLFPLLFGRNMYHEISAIIGIVFIFIFWEKITDTIKNITGEIEGNLKSRSMEKIFFYVLFSMIPFFICSLLIVFYIN